MREELRECPHCGATRGLYTLDEYGGLCADDNLITQIFCDNCKSAFENERANNGKELIEVWNTRTERTCMDMNEAWSDFGANVFDDDALDDFDKFKKIYQICQEIVEPLEFTCWIERTEQDEFGIYDYLSCGHIAMRQWPEKTRYCPYCRAKVVS